MSQAVSPITGRSYGLARVARVWRLARATTAVVSATVSVVCKVLTDAAAPTPRMSRGVRHGSMRRPAAVDATATGDRTNGSDPQRQARGGAGVRPER